MPPIGSRRRPRPAVPRRSRPASYYEVAGVDLRAEAERLRALPVFATGELARREPAIKVRRANRIPNRLGFAVPGEWRISVTAYPGIRAGDVQETLLHELVHLHVGTEPGHRRWHGPEFRRTLERAMAEAYGVTGVRPRTVRHGTYAEAIEALRARARADAAAGQLALGLSA